VNTGTIGIQSLETCFRCKEVGSTNTKRLETNTYIPSYQLSNHLIPRARKFVPSKYAGLITDSGLVQIYVAAMKDLLPFFYSSRHLGIIYQEAVVKSTTSTMQDATSFKKRNAKGAVDGGYYAAVQAKKAFASERGCPGECLLNINPPAWQRHLDCEWSKNTNKYSRGWTRLRGTQFTLEEAKKTCLQMGPGQCKGVTCSKSGHPCTLRAGSLRNSRSGEITYTRSFSCRLGLPEGSVERPLIKGSLATNVSGVCSRCVQFFGKEVHPLTSPEVTPLSETVMSNDEEPAIVDEEGQLPENPDDTPPPSARRRRRSSRRRNALIQKHEENTKKSSN